MSLPVVLGLGWLVLANVAGMIPARDNHWARAWALIAAGLPLLGWIWWEAGWLPATLFLAAAASVLRWPVIYLGRWLRGVSGR
ncbi:DUF2484 family protein [Citreimonas sp.]|uniref:DUF2484 family protein n=1 Tax=Citreimonas sp. TaxID=3036715 RepID=UPI0035C7C4F7